MSENRKHHFGEARCALRPTLPNAYDKSTISLSKWVD